METKDWIMLITPLLFNGIILFALQLFITKHIDKNLKYKDDVLKQCLILIQNTYKLSLNLSLLDPDISGKKDIKFADIWNPYNLAVNELQNFIAIHPNVLDVNAFDLDVFFNRIKTVRGLLYNDKINNDNTMTESTFKAIISNYKLAENDLKHSTDLCEKRILKI